MAGVNQVTVLGNLGQDPELRYTQSQEPVVTMSVATSEQWTDKAGEKHEETEWHRIVVWGKQAENCAKYLAKGHKVCVIGKLKTRSWEKDGVKRYSTEIVANPFGGVHFLGAPQGGGARPPAPTDSDRRASPDRYGGSPEAAGSPPNTTESDLDGIPF